MLLLLARLPRNAGFQQMMRWAHRYECYVIIRIVGVTQIEVRAVWGYAGRRPNVTVGGDCVVQSVLITSRRG
jgi:hypothetical protein